MQLSASYNAATNQPSSGLPTSYDANGNALTGPGSIGYTYDVENRIIWSCQSGTCFMLYGYDPQGKRVLRQTGLSASAGNWALNWEFTFYGVNGQRLNTFNVITSEYANSGYCNGARACASGPLPGYVYFGGKLISGPNGAVLADRLGSQRGGMSYYPWGEEKTSTPNGQVKFATYFRDMVGEDYADQRYYTQTAGRFYTPDPSTGVDLANPNSWNKYVYAGDDPVNFFDPAGRYGDWADGSYDPGLGDWAYCDIACEQNIYWTNVGTYAGSTAQNLVCLALASYYGPYGPRPGCAATPGGDYTPPPPPKPAVSATLAGACGRVLFSQGDFNNCRVHPRGRLPST
jgi:RHS repeat-associated protein